MTPPVFIVPAADLAEASAGGHVLVSGAEGRHAVTVRRLSMGETVCLVDGSGRRAFATVAGTPGRDTLDALVTAVVDEAEPDPRIVVVQALPKGERGELAVEVLTEVGVDAIVPWAAATCVTVWKGDRAERGHRRWSDAASAAAKQARRARFPMVEPLAGTGEIVDRIRAAALAVVLHEDAPLAIGSLDLPATGEVVIVVGPEGGITEQERAAFRDAGGVEARLGPSVLRTSSAGLAAVAALCAGSPRWAVADATGMEG